MKEGNKIQTELSTSTLMTAMFCDLYREEPMLAGTQDNSEQDSTQPSGMRTPSETEQTKDRRGDK